MGRVWIMVLSFQKLATKSSRNNPYFFLKALVKEYFVNRGLLMEVQSTEIFVANEIPPRIRGLVFLDETEISKYKTSELKIDISIFPVQ